MKIIPNSLTDTIKVLLVGKRQIDVKMQGGRWTDEPDKTGSDDADSKNLGAKPGGIRILWE